jgi:hypothetical protein
MQQKTWTHTLDCHLTDDELRQRSAELAQAFEQREKAERHAKEEAKRLKAEVKRHDAKLSELARVLRERKEPRTVECCEAIDMEHGKSSTIRMDTNEVVSVRTLSKDEIERLSQVNIPGTDAEGETDGD